MPEVHVHAEGLVSATADVAYRCIADYRNHHPNILPPSFSDLRVEEGGYGDGTLFTVRSTVMGRTRAFRMIVSEPEPGRVLIEKDMLSSIATRFTVTPMEESSLVAFDTTWQGAPHIGGFFERIFAPMLLRRIYREELIRFDAYARGLTRGRSPG